MNGVESRPAERRARHDGLTDDAVLPGNQFAVLVEPSLQRVHVHRPIEAARISTSRVHTILTGSLTPAAFAIATASTK